VRYYRIGKRLYRSPDGRDFWSIDRDGEWRLNAYTSAVLTGIGGYVDDPVPLTVEEARALAHGVNIHKRGDYAAVCDQ
jgi:hypothetical protein